VATRDRDIFRPTSEVEDASADTTVGDVPRYRHRAERTETQRTRPEATSASMRPSLSGDGVDATSPEAALLRDEIARSRRLALAAIAFSIAGLLVVPLLPEGAIPRWLFGASLPLVTLGNAYLLYLTGEPSRFTVNQVTLAWVVGSIHYPVGAFYVGIFSPWPLLMVFGLYFLGLGQSLLTVLVLYGMFSLPLAAGAALMLSGLVEDPGLITAAGLPVVVQLTIQLLVQAMLVVTIVLARSARRTASEAFRELGEAARAVGKREALIEEARHDLERALKPGGEGRFTGQLIGSYRIGEVVGRGGIGEVYEATHHRTGQPAAIKLLQPRAFQRATTLRRFLREVRIASLIDHPHVVKVLEVSEDSDPLPYLAMELLQGEDLSAILRRRPQLPPPAVVELVRQVGEGISAASRAGIVHRDLKPQNVFQAIAEDGGVTWKVLDFGVSKLLDQEATLTEGMIVGTPIYMAPEQTQGKEVDHRTDLYALAAVAYRALTGTPPFRGRHTAAILYDVVHNMPLRPSYSVTVSPEVDAVLIIGMAKDPAHRFSHASELVAALEDALSGQVSAAIRSRAETLDGLHPWRTSRPRR
jgi:eukaryotic-like serine/threonine-protein kinase